MEWTFQKIPKYIVVIHDSTRVLSITSQLPSSNSHPHHTTSKHFCLPFGSTHFASPHNTIRYALHMNTRTLEHTRRRKCERIVNTNNCVSVSLNGHNRCPLIHLHLVNRRIATVRESCVNMLNLHSFIN